MERMAEAVPDSDDQVFQHFLTNSPDDRWQRTYVRDTTKGKLLVDILHKRVWLWDGDELRANCWHHHMAMVMMVMLFMVEQRLLYRDQYPLLSCFDIAVLLCFLLPHRAITLKEIIRQMEIRHKRRRDSIESAYRR